ncbi:uncharacterized protein LOC124257020 [Haliotis rubra]|uniref:uncharacterized protein LOC124257020 n=1 Tax=Haliotis rubra TaxID=36100 RepID=UPI001EE5F7DA|nr:uncharacterized protein LOC124257020 [Haliotis rubra]
MPKQVISWESPENANSMSDCDPHAEGEHQLSAQTKTDISLFDSQVLLKRIQELEEEKDLLRQQLILERFGLERFAGNDDMIQYYASFRSYKLFKQFFDFVKPSASNMCSMYYTCSNARSLAGRPRNRALIDEMFMFFVRLRLGLPEQDLAVRFNCHISTVSRKIITWADFLYFVLGSVPIWPSRVTVDRHMPPEFQITYLSTRVILDCTERRI